MKSFRERIFSFLGGPGVFILEALLERFGVFILEGLWRDSSYLERTGDFIHVPHSHSTRGLFCAMMLPLPMFLFEGILQLRLPVLHAVPQRTGKPRALLQYMLIVKATRETWSRIYTMMVSPNPTGQGHGLQSSLPPCGKSQRQPGFSDLQQALPAPENTRAICKATQTSHGAPQGCNWPCCCAGTAYLNLSGRGVRAGCVVGLGLCVAVTPAHLLPGFALQLLT